MSCHRPSSLSKAHHHLYSRLMFIFLKFLIPNPPFFFDLHILLHVIKWYFFFKLPPCQKNFLIPLSILFITILGSRNMGMRYIVELMRLELIKVVLPAIGNEFPCQVSNLFVEFSSILAQSTTYNLLAAIGTPR
jgi:hypothetical protein